MWVLCSSHLLSPSSVEYGGGGGGVRLRTFGQNWSAGEFGFSFAAVLVGEGEPGFAAIFVFCTSIVFFSSWFSVGGKLPKINKQ